MTKRNVRVALAGAGSCASSFVQAVAAAALTRGEGQPGVMYDRIGGYHLSDLTFVAAFEADANKIGRDLADALRQHPTVAVQHVQVPDTGVLVRPGPALDGIAGRLADVVDVAPAAQTTTVEDVTAELRRTAADVLVCFLPTGATHAVRAYARACAAAGTAFVNATPEAVAGDADLAALFEDSGVPLLGDDLRSHLGATTLHTALLDLLIGRGLTVKDTYQLNVGGNTDFLNLSDPARSASKQVSKRRALTNAGIDATDVAAGPNGYVKHLGDRKVCFLRIEAENIIGAPVAMEVRLEVEDSPNAAAVVANAVRVAKAAADRKLAGVVDPVCAFLFKSPREGMSEPQALAAFRAFVTAVQTEPGDVHSPPPFTASLDDHSLVRTA
ncbi:inositol-3-phosphate synthase [Streptomyces sp. NPDC102467]|uniref:inositol-3-phosphate synthase n=1 Tax=Streptomyces sp. NPDC102467 TaxID=3366179 RepID=UPI0038203377